MVTFADDRIMASKHNIRHIALVNYVPHEKSTLVDSLADAPGLITREVAAVDLTPQSTDISFDYKMPDGQNDYIINLIDFSAPLDFSSDVTATTPATAAALRITDGALFVVSCNDDISEYTKTVLTRAVLERIKPVLVVNVDTCFHDSVDAEVAYQMCKDVIDVANHIISTNGDDNINVYPEDGTVAFFSGLLGCAFTLTTFLKFYATSDENMVMDKIRGQIYFDPDTKEWTGSSLYKRSFLDFYKRIKKVYDACRRKDVERLDKLMERINVVLKPEDKVLEPLALIKHVMKNWIPTSRVLLELMIHHLPSPSKAQKYRVQKLYKGYDEYATAIRKCNPDGPLMLCVLKMFKASDSDRLFAFGRVFSGKISGGMNVKIKDQKGVFYVHKITWHGKVLQTTDDVPCGNLVLLLIDRSVYMNAILTNVRPKNVRYKMGQRYEKAFEGDDNRSLYQAVWMGRDITLLLIRYEGYYTTLKTCYEKLRMEDHPPLRILHMIFVGRDAELDDQYVVILDSFDGFYRNSNCLSENHLEFLRVPKCPTLLSSGDLPLPVPTNKVPGNPNQFICENASEMLKTLDSLEKCGVFTSLMGEDYAIVWKNGMMYLLVVDILKSGTDENRWHSIIHSATLNFAGVLEFMLECEKMYWLQRIQLLEFFQKPTKYHEDRLYAGSIHPWLKFNVYDLLHMILDIKYDKSLNKDLKLSYDLSRRFHVNLLQEFLVRQSVKDLLKRGQNSWYSKDLPRELVVFYIAEGHDQSYPNVFENLPDFLMHFIEHANKHPFLCLKLIMDGWKNVIHVLHQILTLGEVICGDKTEVRLLSKKG